MSELKREIAIRIVKELNTTGPRIGSHKKHSINPIAELMDFYWVDGAIAVRRLTGVGTEAGWMGYILTNRESFVDLADFFLEDDCQEFSPRVST
jgi:hypothetical protein